MTWPELMGWLGEMARENGQAQGSVDSWEGTENEAFWVEARRRREERMKRG